MFSSAVVIPNQEPNTNGDTNGSSSPSLKRKLSDSRHEERKRPRVDTDTVDYDDKPSTATPSTAETPVSTNGSPVNKRASSAIDEKKRNKRLFGSLLGALAQSNTKTNTAHKKRDEIEARQRERLKRENEDQEAEKKRRKSELAQRRKRQQRHWEEEGQRTRHTNMRAMAGFLKTKTQPVLYYMPWELREEEQEQIRRQKEDVERLIRKELGDVGDDAEEEELEGKESGNGEQTMEEEKVVEPVSTNGDEKTKHDPPEDTGQDSAQLEVAGKETLDLSEKGTDEASATEGQSENANGSIDVDSAKVDDHNGEELVEGQEDDVIY